MRYSYLDGLRGMAAIAVLLFHFSQHGSYQLFPSAYFAVDVFFCLSGFVIANAYASKIEDRMSFRDFASRRLIRLYPMFALGMIVGAVAVWLKLQNGEASFPGLGYLPSLLLNFFYIPAFGAHTVSIGSEQISKAAFPFNDPAWTLFYELIVNFAFFLAWRMKVVSTRTLILLVVISLMILLGLSAIGRGAEGWSTDKSQIVIGFIRTFFGFAAGVLLAKAGAIVHLPVKIGLPGGLLIFAVFVLLSAFSTPFPLLLLASPLFVLLGKDVKLGPKASRFCEILGEISYPLYCIHFSVLVLLDYFGLHPATIPFWGPVLAGLITIAAVATVIVPADFALRKAITSAFSKKDRVFS